MWKLHIRGHGGIGRRARFRSVWAYPRGGSSPLDRILLFTKLVSYITGWAFLYVYRQSQSSLRTQENDWLCMANGWNYRSRLLLTGDL